MTSYVQSLVEKWVDEIKTLSVIAESEPQSAYAALTHGLQNHWGFIQHCHKDIHHLLQPLEDVISTHLLPSLTGRDAPNELERQLIALPARLGGLGITNPAAPSDLFDQSQRLTAPITDLIAQQGEELGDAPEIQQIQQIHSERKRKQKITSSS